MANIRRRGAVTVGIVVAGLAAMPSAAAAHAAFQSASPAPGVRLRSSPSEIAMVFTEPLDRRLSSVQLLDARSGHAISASIRGGPANRLTLHPLRPLGRAAYAVRWHTVSILDGHGLEGEFGFGVGVKPLGHEQQLQETPLASGGWVRVGLRTLWYVSLFFFGGGLLCALALGSRASPARWLLPGKGGGTPAPGGRLDAAQRLIWARTRAAGWIAVAAGAGVVIADTQDAAGSLSWRAVDAYLLSTVSGGARAVAVALVAVAVLLALRAWRIAAVALLAALGAVAVGGHANSASPRALALLSDWAHLVAGAAWIGGLAQIAATWLPGITRRSFRERRRVIAEVLERFGRVALPAAATVVVAGTVNALTELGRLSALWETSYGRVLIVKVTLVGLLLTASYIHAFLLRPRLIGTSAGSTTAVERRHWRLLGSQPAVAGLAVGAGALLAVFPLPPRELLETPAAGAVTPAALRAPASHELSVAEEAGPWIAAAWINPVSNRTSGTLRLLDYRIRPVPARITVGGASVQGCGPGCATFTMASPARSIRVTARLGRQVTTAAVPVGWNAADGGKAERILRQSVAAVDHLRSWQIGERLVTGLGGRPAISHYRIAGRSVYQISYRSASFGETIGIGPRTWVLEPGGTWQESIGSRVDTRQLMPWLAHRTGIRLLGLTRTDGRPTADIALADIHPPAVEIPFWFRLQIDLRSMLPLSMRMITAAHFMDQRYFAFNAPLQIRPPTRTS